jgi:hypothetical protein
MLLTPPASIGQPPPLANSLSLPARRQVKLIDDCIGKPVEDAVKAMKNGEVRACSAEGERDCRMGMENAGIAAPMSSPPPPPHLPLPPTYVARSA